VIPWKRLPLVLFFSFGLPAQAPFQVHGYVQGRFTNQEGTSDRLEIRRARVDPVPDAALERMLAEAAVDPGASDPLLRAAIRKCHEGLPAKPMQALRARLTAGGAEPDRMLSARLDMSLNTFLQNLTRARRLLLECLERHGIAAHEVTG